MRRPGDTLPAVAPEYLRFATSPGDRRRGPATHGSRCCPATDGWRSSPATPCRRSRRGICCSRSFPVPCGCSSRATRRRRSHRGIPGVRSCPATLVPLPPATRGSRSRPATCGSGAAPATRGSRSCSASGVGPRRDAAGGRTGGSAVRGAARRPAGGGRYQPTWRSCRAAWLAAGARPGRHVGVRIGGMRGRRAGGRFDRVTRWPAGALRRALSPKTGGTTLPTSPPTSLPFGGRRGAFPEGPG